MGVHPVTILSLGASSYGATRPDFTLMEIHCVLLDGGTVATPPAAVSLGGKGDVGEGFEPSLREHLLRRVEESEIPLLHEPDLRANVTKRMGVYLGVLVGPSIADAVAIADLPEGPGRVSAFVNIGGNAANLGTSPLVLSVEPGLNESLTLPPAGERGVIHEMAARTVPVIHLLYVRGLALRHGLPWDPIPLPEPGATRLTVGDGDRGWRFWLIVGAYFAALTLIIRPGRSLRVRQPG
jgi:poly-gamma-glutamate system protein